MALPFFFIDTTVEKNAHVVLSEENSKHIVQVLRMQNGESLNLTDGKGNLFSAEITDSSKKKCTVQITATSEYLRPSTKNCIAVSLVKNNTRFEWFLEKATEIGIDEIIPLICTRTEKQHFRYERMKGILISAMLQSQQVWLPVLHEPIQFKKFTERFLADEHQKFIAHCEEENKSSLKEILFKKTAGKTTENSIILIGPEGDFTKAEIEFAIAKNFMPVSLGNTRLRTETAAVAAAVMLTIE
jgi:16S rRNA (uracil1498-N3)-methyltransferase